MNILQKTIAKGHALYDELGPGVQMAILYGVPALAVFVIWWFYNKRTSPVTTALKLVGNVQDANGRFSDTNFESALKSFGWFHGVSWCAYFVKMVFETTYPKKVAQLRTIINPYVLTMWNNAKKDTTGFAKTSTVPVVGSIVCWKSSVGGGHTGIVTKVNGQNFETVEGNTSAKGSDAVSIQNGHGVYHKIKHSTAEYNSPTMKLLGFIVLNL